MTTDKASLGQYGVYLVAAELCKMGYTAVTTSRNAKAVDVLAFNSANGKTAGIQVKTGQRTANSEVLPVVAAVLGEVDNLDFKTPFVFVYIPSLDVVSPVKVSPRYFIVPAEDVKKLLKVYVDYHLNRKHRKPLEDLLKSRWPLKFDLKDLERYEDKWELLGLD